MKAKKPLTFSFGYAQQVNGNATQLSSSKPLNTSTKLASNTRLPAFKEFSGLSIGLSQQLS
jgi:hypothetical protein